MPAALPTHTTSLALPLRSDKFKTHFTSDFQDAHTGHVALTESDGPALQQVIEAIYSYEVRSYMYTEIVSGLVLSVFMFGMYVNSTESRLVQDFI